MVKDKITNTKDLLVICDSYNNFQKSCIEGVSPFFREITAYVRTNPFAELSNIIPIPYLASAKKSNRIDLSGKPENVTVTPTPIFYLPWDRGYKALGKSQYLVVQKTLKKHNRKFDIVHSQFTWSAGYVGARLKEKFEVPFVVTARGYDIYSLPFMDEGWRERIEYVLNTADYITTVSQSNLYHINRLNVSAPVSVVYNGFRTDFFYPRDTIECRRLLHLPSDQKVILTVGNLVPVKGHQFLIDAIDRIADERDDILCIIVGAGVLERSLREKIHSLGLEHTVVLMGGKPHSSIPIWMNACDIFVLPSLNEGNPNVMFEALGCGKPFVGTTVGGIPEIITSERFGLLVEPQDSDDLAKKILIALDREWDPRVITEYAAQFSRDKMIDKMIDIYCRFLS